MLIRIATKGSDIGIAKADVLKGRLEEAGQSLGVVNVHLAPVGTYVIGLHRVTQDRPATGES